ncbi:MAG TPA: glycosyltransferase family 39 protein [Ktedonobacterales bacterium]
MRTLCGKWDVMLGRTDERDTAATADAASPAITGSTPAMAGGAWAFARHWQFWLALALGAFLRLWHIELTQFLQDQRNFYILAREAVLHHALLVTSVTYSIGVYSPPLSADLLVPFAVFGHNPLPAVISIALWNVLGVAICYLFALRNFGRRTAAIAALLLATSSVAVNYSRFIWQPTYWATLLAFWALSLYAGAIRGKRGWLVLNVVALALAALLHPVAAILAPVTVLAVLLAPRRPGKWDYAISALLLAVLLVPSAIFEVLSHGQNLRLYAHTFLKGQGRFGLGVLRSLYGLFGAPTSVDFGPQSPYTVFAHITPVLTFAAALLFAVGYVVVSVAVLRPAVAIWRREGGRARSWAALRAYAGDVWRGLRTDAGWRGALLLWLWVTLPPLSMLHYSVGTPPAVHYLLVILPGAFVVAALGMGWLLDQAARLAGRASTSWTRIAGRAGWVALLAALALLIAGQTVQSASYAGALATGRFDAYNFYGYPLAEMQAADARLGALQRQQGASGVFVVEPATPRFAIGMEYLLVGEHADRAGFGANCLVLPAPAAGPALEAVTAPNTAAGGLLASLPNSSRVAQMAIAGGAPWPVYRVAGATPLLPDERAVAPTTFVNTAGEGLRLTAFAQPAPGLLRLRWDVLGYSPTSDTQPALRVAAVGASGGRPAGTIAGAPSGTTDCQPTRLQAGETLFTWVHVPAASETSTSAAAITVSAGTIAWDLPTLGPLRLLTDRPAGTPLAPLTPSSDPYTTLPSQISGSAVVVPLS